MQSRAPTQESASHTSKSFFGSPPAHSSPFFSSSPAIQPKLTMGETGDRFEREADEMADRVVQRKPAAGVDHVATPAVQLKCAACEAETSPSGLESGLANASGSGSPLARDTRESMEDAFGVDFSAVRVHTGAASAAMNNDIGARAFTHGTDIHFNEGEFTPGTERGTHLLAHELTHVVQQNSGAMQGGAAQAVQRKPKRTQEQRDAIMTTASQAAFDSFEDQLDVQLDAEEILGLDIKKSKDKALAWKLGQRDKERIQKHRTLTTKHKQEITVKIRFFQGDAKRAYIQTINAAVSEVADGEQLTEMLAEPSVPGIQEQEQADGLGCDVGKGQFPMLYEDEPERSTCIDIATDKDLATNYFEKNFSRVDTYAVPGTTWENVDYSSFNAIVVTYKNGKTEYFLLDAVGNFYFGGKALGIREFFYYKRRGTGLIYPVLNGRLYSNEILTPRLISYKNGLNHTVKELKELFALVEATAAFASIIASYSVVEGFRVSLQGFKLPRGTNKPGGGKSGAPKGGGGGGDGEAGGTGRSPGGSGGSQKQLQSSSHKGTGNLTSDPVHQSWVDKGKAKAGQTMYEYKKASTNPDDQAEVRMADRLSKEGYDVHFRANDRGGDLEVGGVRTDVKHSRGNVATQMSSAAQQGADQVAIDGSTAKLTRDQVATGLKRYESMASEMVAGESRVRHPKLRELKTVFIVLGDGSLEIYHRSTGLVKEH